MGLIIIPSVRFAVNQARPWVILESSSALHCKPASVCTYRTRVRIFVRTARVFVVPSGTSRQVGSPMSAVVACVVLKAEVALLATVDISKHPVAARDEVAAGFKPWRVEASPVADGSVGFRFSHAVIS